MIFNTTFYDLARTDTLLGQRYRQLLREAGLTPPQVWDEDDEAAEAYETHQRICSQTHRPRGYRCNLVSPFTF